jgi:hypothetical protein
MWRHDSEIESRTTTNINNEDREPWANLLAGDLQDPSGIQPANNGCSSRSPKTQSGAREGQRFACPFYRYDPILYKDCLHFTLRRLQDVLQHLRRKHDRECATSGSSKGRRNITAEERWTDMFKEIFPDADPPENVRLGGVLDEAAAAVVGHFWRHHSPEVLEDGLEMSRTGARAISQKLASRGQLYSVMVQLVETVASRMAMGLTVDPVNPWISAESRNEMLSESLEVVGLSGQKPELSKRIERDDGVAEFGSTEAEKPSGEYSDEFPSMALDTLAYNDGILGESVGRQVPQHSDSCALNFDFNDSIRSSSVPKWGYM